MSSETASMFSGTADPHVSGSSSPASNESSRPSSTPQESPRPADLQSPPNPVTGRPPEADAGPQPEGGPAPETPQQTAQPSQQQLTDEQLNAVAQRALQAHQTAQAAQAQQAAQGEQRAEPQLSPQERQELFRPVAVTPELFAGIMGFPADNQQQITSLQQFANSIAENALRMSMYYTSKQVEQVNQTVDTRFSPLLQQQQQAQQVQQEQRFMTSYPDLAEHKDLLYELRDAAMSRKMQFASEQEAFNFIAQNARNILAKVRGNNGGQVPQSTPGQPQYAMPSTSMGGATGSGNRSQGQQASPVKQLFN